MGVLVPRMALRVAGVVGAELAALLAVLEAAVLGGPVGVYSLRGAEVVLGFLGRVALLGVGLALRRVGLLLLVVVLAWGLMVALAAGSGGGVVGGVGVVGVGHDEFGRA